MDRDILVYDEMPNHNHKSFFFFPTGVGGVCPGGVSDQGGSAQGVVCHTPPRE